MISTNEDEHITQLKRRLIDIENAIGGSNLKSQVTPLLSTASFGDVVAKINELIKILNTRLR
jgi:hypothetical protein